MLTIKKENSFFFAIRIVYLLVDEMNLMNVLYVMVKVLVQEILYVHLLMVQQTH